MNFQAIAPLLTCVFAGGLQVQFQKIQQLRLSQTRAPYYGGSLPNVNQIGSTSTEFQVGRKQEIIMNDDSDGLDVCCGFSRVS